MIIALGESIVAIGVGAAGLALGAGELAAAALGVIVAAALWWVYFDDALEHVERAPARAPTGRARNVMARDAFSFLHLPLVAGIVLLALGVKKTLEHVDDPLKPSPRSRCAAASRSTSPPTSRSGGAACGSLEPPRLVAAGGLPRCCCRSRPSSPALAALAVVAAICAALVRLRGVARRLAPSA